MIAKRFTCVVNIHVWARGEPIAIENFDIDSPYDYV